MFNISLIAIETILAKIRVQMKEKRTPNKTATNRYRVIIKMSEYGFTFKVIAWIIIETVVIIVTSFIIDSKINIWFTAGLSFILLVK